MDDFVLYSTLTSEMYKDACVEAEEYEFMYRSQNCLCSLKIQEAERGKKLVDEYEIWNAEADGLFLRKKVKIGKSGLLKGEKGVVCRDADFGVCIKWTDKSIPESGLILPSYIDKSREGTTFGFEYEFAPGTTSGNLELELLLYVDRVAASICHDEHSLINEKGFIVGVIGIDVLCPEDSPIEFPIDFAESKEDEALWWVEFKNGEFDDPKGDDLFSADSFCLKFNSFYSVVRELHECNKINDRASDILVDALTETFFLIIKHVNPEDLKDMEQNLDLKPGSICDVLYRVLKDFDNVFNYLDGPDELLLKSLQKNLRKIVCNRLGRRGG